MNTLSPADQHTIEDVIRDPSLAFSSALYERGLYDGAPVFHWHAEPESGFYCLHRPRPDEPAQAEPDPGRTARGDGTWEESCNPHYGPPGLCGGGTTGDGPFGVWPSDDGTRVGLYRCNTGLGHFFSTDADCEGTTVEGPLGWLSATRTSESPRPLRRCYNAGTQTHFHWLDEHCPDGVNEEAIQGYGR